MVNFRLGFFINETKQLHFNKGTQMTATLTKKLPPLNATYQVSKQDVQNYKEHGFIKINDITTAEELEPFREELLKIVENYRQTQISLDQRDVYGRAFLQIGNIWQKSEIIKSFVLAKRFGKIAADLMGVDGVRIYHDQALYKEAGGGHTPWHQDQFYWPIEGNKTITMWMPMVDATREMGLMEFVSGSNKNGMIANINISETSDRIYTEKLQKEKWEATTYDKINAGSATFHSGWTLHRAGPNTTKKMREVMTIIFVADGERVSTPINKNQGNDLNSWFPGLKPGDLAKSHLNPLTYHKNEQQTI